jgi:hypothetical protein
LVAPPHPATLEDEVLLKACEQGRGRAGGPGGQHRNKVETLVMLHHLPTGVQAHAGERRSVVDNRRVAVFRLRLRLATEVRTPVPAGEIRSPLWLTRCDRDGRIACNPAHRDYPAMLALALDVLWAADLDARTASLRLCCTMSQLVKLIKEHPAAMTRVNQARAARGEHPLR